MGLIFGKSFVVISGTGCLVIMLKYLPYIMYYGSGFVVVYR